MAQFYLDPSRESDPHALPDAEVFEATAAEAAEWDEDAMWEARKHFPLATMNSREREKAIAWAVKEYGFTGGWYWWACFPGCLPDSEPIGPFATEAEAIADARGDE